MSKPHVEIKRLQDALDFVLRHRICVANGAFIQRDTTPTPGYGGWYSGLEPGIPKRLAEILDSARQRVAASP